MSLTKEQKNLIVECITGFDGEEAAINYLLRLEALKELTPKKREEIAAFLGECRQGLEEIAE